MADIHIAGKLIPGVVGEKVANAGDIDGLPAAIQAVVDDAAHGVSVAGSTFDSSSNLLVVRLLRDDGSTTAVAIDLSSLDTADAAGLDQDEVEALVEAGIADSDHVQSVDISFNAETNILTTLQAREGGSTLVRTADLSALAGLDEDEVAALIAAYDYLSEDAITALIAAAQGLSTDDVNALITAGLALPANATQVELDAVIASVSSTYATQLLLAAEATTRAGADTALGERIDNIPAVAGDTINISGQHIVPYWRHDRIVIQSANTLTATGFVIPADERIGYWHINLGTVNAIGANQDADWHRVDVAMLFGKDAVVSGASTVLGADAHSNVLTLQGEHEGFATIHFAHTSAGQLLVATSVARDFYNFQIRREVYVGGSTDTPAQFYNFYISHDTSDTAQAGTFPDSGITNHAAAFMNFTQDATGGTTNPFTAATALQVTKFPSSDANVWPNIEHITSTAGIILKAGVPVSIKSSGGIFIGDAGVPSGVVLAQVIRRVQLNGSAFSTERTARFRVRAGEVYIPFDDLSYEVLPAADIPYTESRVEFDIIFTDANGVELTNNISFDYWISPETKETVTQPNHILQATNAASPEPQVIFEGDVSAQTAADRVLTLNFPLPSTGVLEFVGDTAQIDGAVSDTPGRNLLMLGTIRCSDLQGLVPITEAQAQTDDWAAFNKIPLREIGLYDSTSPIDEEGENVTGSRAALWINHITGDAGKLAARVGRENQTVANHRDLAPLTIRWIP